MVGKASQDSIVMEEDVPDEKSPTGEGHYTSIEVDDDEMLDYGDKDGENKAEGSDVFEEVDVMAEVDVELIHDSSGPL